MNKINTEQNLNSLFNGDVWLISGKGSYADDIVRLYPSLTHAEMTRISSGHHPIRCRDVPSMLFKIGEKEAAIDFIEQLVESEPPAEHVRDSAKEQIETLLIKMIHAFVTSDEDNASNTSDNHLLRFVNIAARFKIITIEENPVFQKYFATQVYNKGNLLAFQAIVSFKPLDADGYLGLNNFALHSKSLEINGQKEFLLNVVNVLESMSSSSKDSAISVFWSSIPDIAISFNNSGSIEDFRWLIDISKKHFGHKSLSSIPNAIKKGGYFNLLAGQALLFKSAKAFGVALNKNDYIKLIQPIEVISNKAGRSWISLICKKHPEYELDLRKVLDDVDPEVIYPNGLGVKLVSCMSNFLTNKKWITMVPLKERSKILLDDLGV